MINPVSHIIWFALSFPCILVGFSVIPASRPFPEDIQIMCPSQVALDSSIPLHPTPMLERLTLEVVQRLGAGHSHIPIQSVLTDNGKEFTTHHPSKNHSFERALTSLGIHHRLTLVRHPWTNGACERLNRTILEEFYQVAFRSKIYPSLNELYRDLDVFIEFYNYRRSHHGKRTKGNVPACLYFTHQAA